MVRCPQDGQSEVGEFDEAVSISQVGCPTLAGDYPVLLLMVHGW